MKKRINSEKRMGTWKKKKTLDRAWAWLVRKPGFTKQRFLRKLKHAKERGLRIKGSARRKDQGK